MENSPDPKLISLDPHDVARVLRALPKSILPILVEHGAVLAGGFIRAVIAHEEPKDIDLFVSDQKAAYRLALALSKEGTAIETVNALTVLGYDLPLQVIHRWTYASVHELLGSFDFTVACAAISFGTAGGICHFRFYQDLAAKRLFYLAPVRDEEPGGSLLRVLRFHAKGYTMPLVDFAKVVSRACSKIDFSIDGAEDAFALRLREVDPPGEQGEEINLLIRVKDIEEDGCGL